MPVCPERHALLRLRSLASRHAAGMSTATSGAGPVPACSDRNEFNNSHRQLQRNEPDDGLTRISQILKAAGLAIANPLLNQIAQADLTTDRRRLSTCTKAKQQHQFRLNRNRPEPSASDLQRPECFTLRSLASLHTRNMPRMFPDRNTKLGNLRIL